MTRLSAKSRRAVIPSRRRVCQLTMILAIIFGPLSRAGATEFDAADTSSPRATLKSFLDACNELYRLIQEDHFIDRANARHSSVALRILDCIDTSDLPAFAREDRAAEVAVCLKEVLDRHPLPPWDEIPDVAAIEAAGGLEQLSRWRIPGMRITIARVEDGPQKHEYLFSAGTVDRAIEYLKSVRARPYRTAGPEVSPGLHEWYMSAAGSRVVADIIKHLPPFMRFDRTLGMANWKWPGLLGTLLISIVLMVLLFRLYFAVSRRVRGRRVLSFCLLAIPLAALAIPFLVEHVLQQYLTIRGMPLYVLSFLANAAATLTAMVVVFILCSTVAEAVIASPHVNPKGLNAQLIRIASKLVSVALAVVVFLVGGQYIGIPVGTLLASAGIGGVALALGAQDTLKTLFGTVTLMADKPFRVGERIVFKEYDGVVEDIGLRSTRLRLLSSHQVTLPNDELARSDIENIGRRQYIRRVADIHIPLDTPFEKTETAVSIVREALQDHEGMHPDLPPRVFFLDFLPNAFAIRAIYWYHPPNYWDYLAFSERFNFAIFRAFDQHGIQLSIPHRVTHGSLERLRPGAPADGNPADGNPADSNPAGRYPVTSVENDAEENEATKHDAAETDPPRARYPR